MARRSFFRTTHGHGSFQTWRFSMTPSLPKTFAPESTSRHRRVGRRGNATEPPSSPPLDRGQRNDVGVEFDAAVVEEANEPIPMVQAVADDFGNDGLVETRASCCSSQVLSASTSGCSFPGARRGAHRRFCHGSSSRSRRARRCGPELRSRSAPNRPLRYRRTVFSDEPSKRRA